MSMFFKIVIITLLATCSAVWAQERRERPSAERPVTETQRPPRTESIMESFIAPERVMRRQGDIGLTADQQTVIKSEMDKTMTQFNVLQGKLRSEMEKLMPLIQAEHMDEETVLALSDKITGLENEIKRLRLVMLIRVKNLLTAEQQAILRKSP